MVTRWAVIEAGVVTNVVLWDGDPASWTKPEGSTVVAFDPESHSIAVPITAQNRAAIEAKATAALTANETDIAQDATIRTQALALAATTGNRTTAQLSNDVRALAQGVAILAANDANAKRQLGALIRLMLGLLDSTDGT